LFWYLHSNWTPSVGVSVSSCVAFRSVEGFLHTSDGRYALENVCTTTINRSLCYPVPPVDSGVFQVLLRGFIGVSLRCFFRNV
jgi:hypothetical protein